MYGMRVSLLVGLSSVLVALAVGVAVGLVAGYAGGITDTLLMRVADVQLTFPSILTALLVDGVISAALPQAMRDSLQIEVIIFAIGISLWPNFARTIRGSTLVERNKDYVMAARVIGVPSWRIMVSHVLPNVIGPVLVIGTLGLGAAVIDGGDPVFPGRRAAADRALAWDTDPIWKRLSVLRPMVGDNFSRPALVLMVLAINVLGDWLRDALNPRLR